MSGRGSERGQKAREGEMEGCEGESGREGESGARVGARESKEREYKRGESEAREKERGARERMRVGARERVRVGARE